MKLPRDVDGAKLARRLIRLGYHSMRQTGSHIVIQPPKPGQQPIGIPAHRNLKTGMLHRILSTAGDQLGLSIEEMVVRLKL